MFTMTLNRHVSASGGLGDTIENSKSSSKTRRDAKLKKQMSFSAVSSMKVDMVANSGGRTLTGGCGVGSGGGQNRSTHSMSLTDDALSNVNVRTYGY